MLSITVFRFCLYPFTLRNVAARQKIGEIRCFHHSYFKNTSTEQEKLMFGLYHTKSREKVSKM